ncbi:UPF0371 protein FN1121 [Aduncisulcus paluster]|uniref:UPF0371 protein FN1121 n=1 Tax=Aduncisulcus paluster TaxID=2918883 RepID=A0ABQ5KR15_9EUKA|nr:UPF0371 protein FN1121 [Aduncisulcus paluster]
MTKVIPCGGRIGFDSSLYLDVQSKSILERVEKYEKLYLEVGGKLSHDMHAGRILPGYEPDCKLQLFKRLASKLEIIIAIWAEALEKKKVRADLGCSYEFDVFRMIDEFKENGISVAGVVITRFDHQPSVSPFMERLEKLGIKTYTHSAIKGYPDPDVAVSDAGFGSQAYIETTKPVVVITGPGPNSGKLATALSQVYHEHSRKVKAGYAKLESFPVWNLPLLHPINIAYEAATADLGDYNLIDSWHKEAYGIEYVNYNRDVEAFPIVARLLEKIMGEEVYKSPTEMGVNAIGGAIIDDSLCRKAARSEIARRWFSYGVMALSGRVDLDTVKRSRRIMDGCGIAEDERAVVAAARGRLVCEKPTDAVKGVTVVGAVNIPSVGVITGRNSSLFHCSSAIVLKSLKVLAGVSAELHVLPKDIVSAVGIMKGKMGGKSSAVSLGLDETLTALAISASMDSESVCAKCLAILDKLRGLEMHFTSIPTGGDAKILRALGIVFSCDPVFSSKKHWDYL